MSGLGTIAGVVIARAVMQRWAEVERVKTYPYEASEAEVRRHHVVAAYHHSLRENRPVRRAYAK